MSRKWNNAKYRTVEDQQDAKRKYKANMVECLITNQEIPEKKDTAGRNHSGGEPYKVAQKV